FHLSREYRGLFVVEQSEEWNFPQDVWVAHRSPHAERKTEPKSQHFIPREGGALLALDAEVVESDVFRGSSGDALQSNLVIAGCQRNCGHVERYGVAASNQIAASQDLLTGGRAQLRSKPRIRVSLLHLNLDVSELRGVIHRQELATHLSTRDSRQQNQLC